MTVAAKSMIKARQLLKLSQGDFAGLVGVSRSTISKVERGEIVAHENMLERVRVAVSAAGVEFIAEEDGGVGMRLRKGTDG